MSLNLSLGLLVGLSWVASGPVMAAKVASDIRLAASAPKTSTGTGVNLAELAAQVAAERSAASPSPRPAAGAKSVPTSVPPDTLMDPSTYINPIMKSKLVKDLEHLVSVSHGKMSNFNQQSLDSLASDLGIKLPRSVAPHLATSTSKPTLEAQVLDPSVTVTGTGTVNPAPVPEPGSLVIFGLAAFGLAARSRLGPEGKREK